MGHHSSFVSVSSKRPSVVRSSRLSVTLATALTVAVFGGPWCSFAQVLPAGTTGTRMDQAGNGVPLVQIAAPNGRGVSHNQYREFNVDPSGLILNNSAGTVQSQLGGYIEGNPNLGGTPAGIILNEVTSLQPSQLRGYLEVAGPRAEVIVANPNGITCEGCGFINTSRGVLTTGTPVFGGDGSLAAFRVDRGRITVQGQGLDGSGTGRIDLLARAVEVNAGLWANKLNIVTGVNEVGHADLSARAIQGEGEAPQFSLDVAGLGGMYAQKIRLVGTEAGVGVRSAGTLVAQGGDFVLTSAGDIRLSGRTAAAGDARITGQAAVELSGTTSAEGRLTVEGAQIALGGTNYAGRQLQAISSGALTQSGQTLSDGAAELRGHTVRVDGAVQGDTLQLSATGALTVSGQANARQLNANAGTLNNSGQLYGGERIGLQVGGTVTNRGVIASDGTVQAQAGALDNQSGRVLQLGSDGTLTLEVGALDNRNGGLIGAEGRVRIDAGQADNSGGAVQSGDTLTLNTTGELRNVGGRIESQGAATVAAQTLNNREGHLVSGGALLVRANDTLDNSGGILGSSGEAVHLNAGSLDNTSGQVIAQTDLDLDIAQLRNAGGQLYAHQALRSNRAGAALDNRSGQIGAGERIELTASSLDNSAGRIVAQDVFLQLGLLAIADGQIAGNHTLQANLSQISGLGRLYGGVRNTINFSGDYTHLAGQRFDTAGELALTVAGLLMNQGTLDAYGALRIQAGALNNQGLLNSGNPSRQGLTDIRISGAVQNSGRIEGDRLQMTADQIGNTGTLLGDTVRLEASGDLVNGRDLGDANAITDYGEGFIGAVEALDLRAGGSVRNLDAEIYSAGDLWIGGLADGANTGRLLNRSGRIQAEGDLTLRADRTDNERRLFQTQWYTLTDEERTANRREHVADISRYDDEVVEYCAALSAANPNLRCTDGALVPQSYETWELIAVEQLLRASAESQLRAGGAMTINGAVRNHVSQIAAGGDLGVQAGAGAVENIAWQPTAETRYQRHKEVNIEHRAGGWNHDSRQALGQVSEDTHIALPSGEAYIHWVPDAAVASTITANGNIHIEAGDLSNTTVTPGTVVVGLTPGQLGQGGPQNLPLTRPDGWLPPLGRLYTLNPDGRYLIETDPRFADYGQWISSDYLLGRLGYDPDRLHKRLGDGYYEQRLILDQILQLTGYALLGQVEDALAQYRALMDAAADIAGAFELSPGVALTAGQIAALNQDIVWLVEQEVEGQTVLVPVVYLSRATVDGLRLEGGAAIAGQNVQMNLSGTLTHTGQIAAMGAMKLDATELLNSGTLSAGQVLEVATLNDLVNRDGLISAGEVRLSAGRDLISDTTVTAGLGGVGRVSRIQADNNLILEAGRDLSLTGTTVDAGGSASLAAGRDLGLSRTDAPNVAGVNGVATEVNVAGNLWLDAGQDLAVTASTAAAGQNLVASAGRDVAIASAAGARHFTLDSEGNTIYEQTTQDLNVGGLSAGQNLVVAADRDVNLAGARLQAGDGMALSAGRDLNSTTVTTTDFALAGHYQHNDRREEIAIDQSVHGTRIEAGGDIALQAGRDAVLQAAGIYSEEGGIGIAAGRDVILGTAQEQHDWSLDTQKKKSGTLSSSTTTTHDATQDRLAIGATLSGETVQIAAGRDLSATAAQVGASDDVLLAAGRDLSIAAGQNTHSEEHDYKRRKSGLFGGGAGVTVGTQKLERESTVSQTTHTGSLIGSVEGRVDLIAGGDVAIQGSDIIGTDGIGISGQNVTIAGVENTLNVHEQQKFRQSGISVGLKGGIVDAAVSAVAHVDRAGEVEDDRLKALHGIQGARDLVNVGKGVDAIASGQTRPTTGLSLRVGIGGSSSRNTADYRETTVQGSRILSDGDVTIAATGDGQGNGGNLSVLGSQIGGDNVTLAAANDLVLQSMQETSEQHTTNQAKSGGMGVSIGAETGGIGLYTNYNRAKGHSDGYSTSHVETRVDANSTLTLISGNDTTLQGAQVGGETVIGRIGGNLSLISEQDTSTFDRKNQQSGFDLAVGIGGGSISGYHGQQKIESDYRSVREQTGIQAGDGGFDIIVGGHTELVGAAIASTADPSQNTLSTGSLSVSDLKNEAEYSASGWGVNISAGSSGIGGSPSLSIPQGEDASSTTKSDIAAGTVEIRNGDESALASLDRTVTELQNEGLQEIFDERKVQERQELGQLAGQVGFGLVGDIANAMQRQAMQDLADAQARGDQVAIDEATARMEAWSDGSLNKTLLHGAVGAAVAALGDGSALGGALGAGVSEKLKSAMASYLESQGIERGSGLYNTLMELGSAGIGGMVGNGSGAATALSGDQFNRQLHPDEINWILQNVGQFALEQQISEEEAKHRLLLEAAAQVDAQWERLLGTSVADSEGESISGRYIDGAASDFLKRNTNTYSWGQAFSADESAYYDPNLFKDYLSGDIRAFEELYNALAVTGGVSKRTLQDMYFDQLQARADKLRGEDGRLLMGIWGGSALGGGAAAVAVEAITACLFNPTTCNGILHGAADAVMGDAIGGQSLAVGGAAAAAGREVVSEMAERTAANVLRAGENYQNIVGRIPGHILSEADAINPGVLGGDLNGLANTFSGGRYVTVELTESVTVYRVWTPGQSKEFGAFWSLDKPAGSLQSRIDSALLPEWGSIHGTPFRAQATHYTEIVLPPGTVIHVGEVGSQGSAWVGGKSQLLIEGGAQAGWRVDGGNLR